MSFFNKNTRRVLSYDVLRQQRTGVMTGGFDIPSSPAYNVEPVTNTSSSSCANNGRRTPRWVLDVCRRSSRRVAKCVKQSHDDSSWLCFTHFATRTVDNIVDLYAAKPDIRPESRFCLPHLHSTPPFRGFSSEYCQTAWYVNNYVVAIRWWKKIEDMFIRFNTIHERDRHTYIHTQTPHDGIGRAYA